MKILIASNKNSYINPYVSTLANGLSDQGLDVVCSIEEFWKNACKYDLVHIQWPNLLEKEMDEYGDNLNAVLQKLKKLRIPIVVTLHNLVPHYSSNKKMYNAYDLVYRNADCFIHLGKNSIPLLQEQIPEIQAKHFVIPHHTYDEIYKMNVDRLVARHKLGVPLDAKCILCFGSFRDDEERDLVLNLRKRLDRSYYFLMPGFYRGKILRKNIIKSIKTLWLTIKYQIIAWKNNLHVSHKYISDEDVPFYMASADVLLVQRLKILNSGNISLAMLAGIPVVGPNVGNVGWMLQQSGNKCFNVKNTDELPRIIENAVCDSCIGKSNKFFAEKNLSTSFVAKETKLVYEQMVRELKNI